ncbi:MAG: C39 family peptidase, partial [Minisyncoccales bacterium]
GYALENENDRFIQMWETLLSCHQENHLLLTTPNYWELVKEYEKKGGKVLVNRTYLPLGTTTIPVSDDPLNFYCVTGGSAIEDYSSTLTYLPPASGGKIGEELKESLPPEVVSEIEFSQALGGKETLNCPVELPLGNLVDAITSSALTLRNKMDSLVNLLNQLANKIGEMNVLISQCTDQNCQVECRAEKNQCYLCCDAERCGSCVNSCHRQALDCAGECEPKDGKSPCPLDKIASTTEEIKKIEDTIFAFINEAKPVFSNIDNITTSTPEKTGWEQGVFVQGVRLGLTACSQYTTEQGKTEGWYLIDCPTAINMGAVGPGGAVIGNCHPYNFFCCVPMGTNLAQFGYEQIPRYLKNSYPPMAGWKPEELIASSSFPATSQAFQKVPCLKQSDPQWGWMIYGPEENCTTYRQGGCGPTSLAMILSYFERNKAYTVPQIGDQIVKIGGRVCPRGTSGPSLVEVAKQHGFPGSYQLKDLPFEEWKEEVKKCFANGGLMIGYVEYPLIETRDSGHFIAITGLTDDGNYLIVNDTVYTRRNQPVPCPRLVPVQDIYNARRYGNQSGFCIIEEKPE